MDIEAAKTMSDSDSEMSEAPGAPDTALPTPRKSVKSKLKAFTNRQSYGLVDQAPLGELFHASDRMEGAGGTNLHSWHHWPRSRRIRTGSPSSKIVNPWESNSQNDELEIDPKLYGEHTPSPPPTAIDLGKLELTLRTFKSKQIKSLRT